MRAILIGGIAAGVLDILAAITQGLLRGGNPVRLLQTIASGWLGTAAYEGGNATAALGLASHFMIATGAAAVFVLASRSLPWLRAHPWVSGPFYGIVVWCAMQFVVLPLSAFPHTPARRLTGVLIGLAIHVVCVGLPIALAARAFGDGKGAALRQRAA